MSMQSNAQTRAERAAQLKADNEARKARVAASRGETPAAAPTAAPAPSQAGALTRTEEAIFGITNQQVTEAGNLVQIITQAVIQAPAIVGTSEGKAPAKATVDAISQSVANAIADVVAPNLSDAMIQDIVGSVTNNVVSNPKIISNPPNTPIPANVAKQIKDAVISETIPVDLPPTDLPPPPSTLTPKQLQSLESQIVNAISGGSNEQVQTTLDAIQAIEQENAARAGAGQTTQGGEPGGGTTKPTFIPAKTVIDRTGAAVVVDLNGFDENGNLVDVLPEGQTGSIFQDVNEEINFLDQVIENAPALGEQLTSGNTSAYIGPEGLVTTPPEEGVTPPGGTTPAAPTGFLTQADLDAALAKQREEFERRQRETASQSNAEREAERRATRQRASDRLVALFKSYGLENLAGFINDEIMNDTSEEMLMVKLYDRPEYQARFPGMASLRKQGKSISEKEYMSIEKSMEQTARFFDLPTGFYDNPADFGDLIGKGVSAKEYQDRLQVGQDLARSLNPGVKGALVDLYGIGEGALTAYVLNPDKALSLIQKQAKAAQFVGIAKEVGFTLPGITGDEALGIAGTASYANLSEQQLQKSLEQAGQLRREQARLAGIEGEPYNEREALNAVIEGSGEAILASQRRAQREVSRFSQRSGLTGTSLTRQTNI